MQRCQWINALESQQPPSCHCSWKILIQFFHRENLQEEFPRHGTELPRRHIERHMRHGEHRNANKDIDHTKLTCRASPAWRCERRPVEGSKRIVMLQRKTLKPRLKLSPPEDRIFFITRQVSACMQVEALSQPPPCVPCVNSLRPLCSHWICSDSYKNLFKINSSLKQMQGLFEIILAEYFCTYRVSIL